MKYCFIINPMAGKEGRAEALVKEIQEGCARENAEYNIFVSNSIEETNKYVKQTAQEATEKVTFVSCGGDGTLCKTVAAVMSLDEKQRKNIGVGVLPVGTGNDFVKNFADKNLFLDINAQLNATPYEIDLIKCNDIYSINMINIGFDCHVVCKKEEMGRKKFLPRKFAYIVALVLTLIKKPGVRAKLFADKVEKGAKQLLLTTLANGSFCGGGFKSNPTAILDDGKIDCIEIKNVSRTKFISLVDKYKKGLHLAEKFKDTVSHFKCMTADMYFDQKTPVSVDGEVIQTKELHLSVAKKALTIMLPQGVLPNKALADGRAQ